MNDKNANNMKLTLKIDNDFFNHRLQSRKKRFRAPSSPSDSNYDEGLPSSPISPSMTFHDGPFVLLSPESNPELLAIDFNSSNHDVAPFKCVTLGRSNGKLQSINVMQLQGVDTYKGEKRLIGGGFCRSVTWSGGLEKKVMYGRILSKCNNFCIRKIQQ
jgi:hypothetical protein